LTRSAQKKSQKKTESTTNHLQNM